MAVGAANTEGGDARVAHFVLPLLRRHRHGKGAFLELKRRVWRVKIQHWRNFSATDRQNGFQQSGNARRGIQVTNVALHGTQRAALLRRAGSVDVAQGFYFNRVSQRRAGSVGFNVADLPVVDGRQH